MKLHQLRYLAAVAQSGLNITAAAHKLHTSQPGVSKQIKLLEDELGFQIFVREGRNLTRITPAGQQVIERALRILQEAQSIRDLSTELRDEGKGSLSIGTTHTQARYVLPGVIRQSAARYPQVRLNLHQGTSEQIAEMVALGSDRLRHRDGVRRPVRRPDAAAVLPLAPYRDRPEGPRARWRRQAQPEGAGRVSADHLHLHRGMKLDLPSAAAKAGTIPGVRTPIMIDGAPMAAESPSPRLGEHTAEILREIGEG